MMFFVPLCFFVYVLVGVVCGWVVVDQLLFVFLVTTMTGGSVFEMERGQSFSPFFSEKKKKKKKKTNGRQTALGNPFFFWGGGKEKKL
jgi:hypothetical protein